MTHFDQIAEKNQCDKGAGGHCYGAAYEELAFSHLPPDGVITIFEAGLHFGSSLRMWNELFPNARIFGVDFDPNYRARWIGERFTGFLGDVNDAAFMANVLAKVGPIDLAVDDGSHMLGDIRVALETVWPSVKPDGVYVIEDVAPDIERAVLDLAPTKLVDVRRSAHEAGFAIIFYRKEK